MHFQANSFVPGARLLSSEGYVRLRKNSFAPRGPFSRDPEVALCELDVARKCSNVPSAMLGRAGEDSPSMLCVPDQSAQPPDVPLLSLTV